MHVRINRVRTRCCLAHGNCLQSAVESCLFRLLRGGAPILTAEKSRRIVPVVPRTHFPLWQVTPVLGRDVS